MEDTNHRKHSKYIVPNFSLLIKKLNVNAKPFHGGFEVTCPRGTNQFYSQDLSCLPRDCYELSKEKSKC